MMKPPIVFALLSLLAAAPPARAGMVESGMYYNPAEPGRGYSIEQQGSNLALVFYVYDASGDQVWYYATAGYALNGAGLPSMTAPLNRTSGGQCLGCSYRAPESAPVASVDVEFSSPSTATIAISPGPGAGASTIAVTRFPFSNAANPLLGQWAWAYSIGAAPTYRNTFGGYVSFATVGAPVNPGGTGLVSGYPASYGGECYLKGSLAGSCLIVQTTSPSFVEAYVIKAPANEWRGTYQIVTGSNNRYPTQGLRLASSAEAPQFGLDAVAVAANPIAAPASDSSDPSEAAKLAADRAVPPGARPAPAQPSAAPAQSELDAAIGALAARLRP